MDEVLFTRHVRDRLGTLDDDEAERAIDVSLKVLAEAFSRRLTEHVARALPERRAATMLAVPTYDLGGDAEALYARLARRIAVPIARALEVLQAVTSTIAETLDAEVLAMIDHELSPSLAALLRPIERAPAPHHEPAPGERSTLSEGKPGSRHPVSTERSNEE